MSTLEGELETLEGSDICSGKDEVDATLDVMVKKEGERLDGSLKVI